MIAYLFLLGIAVGIIGTLLGVGGGFILVPIFLLILHYSPQHAIGTSLAVVFFNAVSGTTAYIRQHKIFYHAGVRFAVATIPGAFVGSYLASYFTNRTFHIAFGILLVVIAIIMYIRTRQKQAEKPFDKDIFVYNVPLGVTLSFFVGFLSSILGIGGGIIHVPAMVYLLGFPTHIATATSQFVLGISALVGVSSHLLLGNVLTVPALTIGLGAVVGAQLGARLSLKVKSRPILIMFSLVMMFVGIRLITAA